MTTHIILAVVLVLALLLLILYMTPKKVYLDRSSNIVLQTYLGKFREISLRDITLRDVPVKNLNRLWPFLGCRCGKAALGKFYNKSDHETYYLFITGKKEARCFEYYSKKYIIDYWE